MNGVVCSAESNCITVTVVPDPTVNITGAGPVCVGGTVTLTANISGGTGTYTVVWERKLGAGGTFAAVETDNSVPSGSTATHNTSTALVAGDYYYRVVVSNTLGCAVTSAEVLGVVRQIQITKCKHSIRQHHLYRRISNCSECEAVEQT